MSQSASSTEVGDILRMLGDPTRWRIFLILRRGSTSVGALAAELQMTEKLVSHHLQVLRRSGVVQAERDTTDARWVYYRLDPTFLAQVYGTLHTLFGPLPTV